MPTPDTELLELLELPRAMAGRVPVLVPVLCGIVVAGSWFAACLAIVLPA